MRSDVALLSFSSLKMPSFSRLKTITRSEGQIRLSQDDGPPAHEFLEDDESTEDALELDAGDVGRLPERRPTPPAQPTQPISETS